jgi:hypothetical protein
MLQAQKLTILWKCRHLFFSDWWVFLDNVMKYLAKFVFFGQSFPKLIILVHVGSRWEFQCWCSGIDAFVPNIYKESDSKWPFLPCIIRKTLESCCCYFLKGSFLMCILKSSWFYFFMRFWIGCVPSQLCLITQRCPYLDNSFELCILVHLSVSLYFIWFIMSYIFQPELFLGLLVKAMKNDVMLKRVAAFSKRLLQVCCFLVW